MKNRPWIKYLLYLILLLVLIYLDAYVGRQQALYQHHTFNMGLGYHLIFMFIRIAIGLLLGLDYITNEMTKEGKWKINVPKMTLMVLASLYFSFVLYLYLIPNEFLMNVLMKPAFILFQGQFKITSIFPILLGYFFITSFQKRTGEE
ncbi:MAG: hypothetical protein GX053_00395 [Tissierella sp.]|nr:hypothetical protein [Tissierella sp.]